MDKGKKIVQKIDEEDEIYLKRDRSENEGIAEPSDEEEHIPVKKARVEAPLSIFSYHVSTGWPGNQECGSCGSHIDKGTCSSSNVLHNTKSLMDWMDSVPKLQGLDGVPSEAPEVVNSRLDEYLRRINHPWMNSVQLGSYQVTMQEPEVPVQMNMQWNEQLGYVNSPATFGDPISVCTGGTQSTGIDLNQHPNLIGTSTQDNKDVDLSLSLDVASAWPILASASGSNIMSSAGISAGKGTSASLTHGPIPSMIPLWSLNLSSSENAANARSTGMDMAHNLALIGSASAASRSSDTDIPDNLACIDSGGATITGVNMPENLSWVGHGTGTEAGTGSIFFIGSPEHDNTESMANQMEWVNNVNGPQNTGVSHFSTGSIFFIGSPKQDNTESMANQMGWAENVNGIQHTGVIQSITSSIFFIGTPEHDDTESMANQMEWAEDVIGVPYTGINSVDTVSGSDSFNRSGCISLHNNSSESSGSHANGYPFTL